MKDVNSWEDFTGVLGPAMKEKAEARIAKVRALNEQVPVFGPLVDQALTQGDGESDGAYAQRRVDLLILAAFTLFANTHPAGQNAALFLEYAQSVATTQLIAMGNPPMPEDVDTRIKDVQHLLAKELRLGEDYALVLFSLNKLAWATSTHGDLGAQMIQLAAKAVRAQSEAARPDSFEAQLVSLLSNIGKSKTGAPPAEPAPTEAPTFMDGPAPSASDPS